MKVRGVYSVLEFWNRRLRSSANLRNSDFQRLSGGACLALFMSRRLASNSNYTPYGKIRPRGGLSMCPIPISLPKIALVPAHEAPSLLQKSHTANRFEFGFFYRGRKVSLTSKLADTCLVADKYASFSVLRSILGRSELHIIRDLRAFEHLRNNPQLRT